MNSAHKRDPPHALGCHDSARTGDQCAHRMAANVDRVDTQIVEHLGEPLDERNEAGPREDGGAVAVTRQVHRDHPTRPGERIDLRCPRLEPEPDTVEEHDRLTLAGGDIRGTAAGPAPRQGWRRHDRDLYHPSPTGARSDAPGDRRRHLRFDTARLRCTRSMVPRRSLDPISTRSLAAEQLNVLNTTTDH